DKMAVGMKDMVRSFDVVRVRGEERASAVDRAATEEPLEIRLHRRPFAVIMRTPGADRELAAGFLLAERVIAGADDLGTVEHCILAPERGADNTVNVTLIDPARVDRLLAERRQVTTNSSCGLCGRQTIESLVTGLPPLRVSWTVLPATLVALPPRLRAAQ